MDGAEGLQAALGGFEFGEAAAFLFDEIVLGAADAFRGRENSFPIGVAFAKQNRVALCGIRRPFFEVQRADAARVGANPGHGIEAGFEAGAHIKLKHDVGTCLKAGFDPVAWIRANPGRIRSLHLKEWSSDPAKGYSVLFGEGNADWKGIFAAAESVGGAEYYLIEQEGSRFSELETAQRCLQALRAVHPR